MREIPFFAPPKFVTFPFRYRQLFAVLRNTVPEILDQLQTLGFGQLEERRVFGTHA
jgi:hypothetical protein